MGRKTYESIGKPLPERDNFIISSTLQETPGIRVVQSISEAIDECDHDKDLWFIGGRAIYQEAMNYADKIVLTIVPDDVQGDNLIYFPWINPLKFYTIENSEEKLGNNLVIETYWSIYAE
jgi:dihydrofolate reductase